MFKQTKKNIAALKAAFALFISTLENLTRAFEANTAEHKLLRAKFDEVAEHTQYLSKAKKDELRRAGHRS